MTSIKPFQKRVTASLLLVGALLLAGFFALPASLSLQAANASEQQQQQLSTTSADTYTGQDQKIVKSNSLFISNGEIKGPSTDFVALVNYYNGLSDRIFVNATSNISGADHTLHGPRGMMVAGGILYLANQNTNQPYNGEILKFDVKTGKFLGALVDRNSADAPTAPRGIVKGEGRTLYVADQESNDPTHGYLRVYNLDTGALLPNAAYVPQAGLIPSGEFHPRGLVFGEDGLLYITVADFTDREAGYVLTFNTSTHEFKKFVGSDSTNNYAGGLHRPEGLAFAPDGKLWVTSFKNLDNPSPGDNTDKVLAFNGESKAVSSIQLDAPGANPRTWGQAILFGPDGRLFIPISTTGELRSYDTHTGNYKVIPTTVSLDQPTYLVFQSTNPMTLEYEG